MPTRTNLGKTAVVFAVILIVSLGLCGFGYSLSAEGEAYPVLALSGLGLFVGLVGLVVTGIVAIVRSNSNKVPK